MTTAPKSHTGTLTPELAVFISSRAASGRYQSANEVLRAALYLLDQDEVGLLSTKLPTKRKQKEAHVR